MQCIQCAAPIPDERRDCPSCGTDNGFPNVRLASKSDEVEALEKRVEQSRIGARARNCEIVWDKFRSSVASSRAVMARSLAVVQDLASSDSRLFGGHLKALRAGTKTSDGGPLDSVRVQFESAVSPNFHEEIVYACLSLTNEGLSAFGDCLLVLKEGAIAHRATVFEENPYKFCQRHKLVIGSQLPAGYRAVWGSRGDLAVAKLGAELGPETKEEDFQHILLKPGKGTAGSDFIEVHIFGTINRHSIERVVSAKPPNKHDSILLKRLSLELASVGTAVEVTR